SSRRRGAVRAGGPHKGEPETRSDRILSGLGRLLASDRSSEQDDQGGGGCVCGEGRRLPGRLLRCRWEADPRREVFAGRGVLRIYVHLQSERPDQEREGEERWARHLARI